MKKNTPYYYLNNSDNNLMHQLLKRLGLSDLKESNHELDFRFWRHGQTVDITKDNTLIVGTVTNYI